MKTEKGWKVMLSVSDELISIFSFAGVIYRANEWAVRPTECGPLCVFESLQNAIEFVVINCRQDYGVIYACGYEPSDETSVWDHQIGYPRTVQGLPPGTRLADRVKLYGKAIPLS